MFYRRNPLPTSIMANFFCHLFYDSENKKVKIDLERLTIADMKLLAEFIKGSQPRSLFILSATIDAEAWELLTEVLQANASIEKLKIKTDNFYSENCRLFCQYIRETKILTYFDIAECNIELKGFILLNEALKENTSLTTLVLSRKFAGELTFSEYYLDIDKLRSLKSMLEINQQLTTIIMPQVKNTEKLRIIQQIQGMLRRNKLQPKLFPTACAVSYLALASYALQTNLQDSAILGIFSSLPFELIDYIAWLMVKNGLPELSKTQKILFFNQNGESAVKKSISVELKKIMEQYSPRLVKFLKLSINLSKKEKKKIFNAAAALLSVINSQAEPKILINHAEELKKIPLAAIYQRCIAMKLIDMPEIEEKMQYH